MIVPSYVSPADSLAAAASLLPVRKQSLFTYIPTMSTSLSNGTSLLAPKPHLTASGEWRPSWSCCSTFLKEA